MQNMHPVNQEIEKSLESYPFDISSIISKLTLLSQSENIFHKNEGIFKTIHE